MRYLDDVLITAIDNYGVQADWSNVENALEMFCIKPQVVDGSNPQITDYQFATLVEYLGENF